MEPVPKNLFELLRRASRNAPSKGVFAYKSDQTENVPSRITYTRLLQQAINLGQKLRVLPKIKPHTIFLIHLDSHLDNIIWLWSVIAAGYVPAISTPFSNDLEQRKRHLVHLKGLLQDPIVITNEDLKSQFTGIDFQIHTVESLEEQPPNPNETTASFGYSKASDDLAVLMLTSGSTGNAKAVCLRHSQIISSLIGKATYHQTGHNDVFLNWIGMDHVANLTEIHLHAIALGAEQFHVPAMDLLASPLLFLELIERHRVTYSFSPNFFLASVKKALEGLQLSQLQTDKIMDLSTLRCLISGGEANSTALCAEVDVLMRRFGAPDHFIRPGFGMTETCAGSIYSTKCPSYDLSYGTEFATLGHCVPGLAMRITRPDNSLAAIDETGNLELSGPILFREYFNNPEATLSSFTPDRWFITGDRAFIDDLGNLHMTGRQKETIIINGVKYAPHEIESAIENARIDGVTLSYTAVFAHRPQGADSESLCVVYLPSYGQGDLAARATARSSIRNAVMKSCMVWPHRIIPLDASLLPKSSLGKLSRIKIKKAFEIGAYDSYIELDDLAIAQSGSNENVQPSTPTESRLQEVFSKVFGLPKSEIGIHTNVYDIGCSSLELFKLKHEIQTILSLTEEIPITTFITNQTIYSLTAALEACNNINKSTTSYNPVVVLRSTGTKTPLWLIHPGIGEVLVFLNLARLIIDRPVYALRARGFDGEQFFSSIPEMVSCYHTAIKSVQPEGPYAIAGYSYGGMLAFELAKVMQSQGDLIPFLAVFDQPPHMKYRVSKTSWGRVLLMLAKFYDLGDEVAKENVRAHLSLLDPLDEEDKMWMVDQMLGSTSPERFDQLGLTRKRLVTAADLALNSHKIASYYDPVGRVPLMEVFYADPIKEENVATKKEWLVSKLSLWGEFVDDARFHEVKGHHFDMISPENVSSFWQVFDSRLEERGL